MNQSTVPPAVSQNSQVAQAHALRRTRFNDFHCQLLAIPANSYDLSPISALLSAFCDSEKEPAEYLAEMLRDLAADVETVRDAIENVASHNQKRSLWRIERTILAAAVVAAHLPDAEATP